MLTVPVKSLAVLRVKVLAPALIRFRLSLILPAPKIVKLLRLESLVKAAGVTTTPEPIITPVTKPGVSSKRTLSPGKKVSLALALRLGGWQVGVVVRRSGWIRDGIGFLWEERAGNSSQRERKDLGRCSRGIGGSFHRVDFFRSLSSAGQHKFLEHVTKALLRLASESRRPARTG